MSLEAIFERPLLKRYPDARRSPLLLFDAVLLAYLGLAAGAGVAGLIGCYNAASMRRFGLAIVSLLAGAAGWLSFAFVVMAIDRATNNPSLAVFAGRALHFVVGGALYFAQRRAIRGHVFLGGRMLPFLQTYLVSVAAVIFMPSSILWFLLGGVFVR